MKSTISNPFRAAFLLGKLTVVASVVLALALSACSDSKKTPSGEAVKSFLSTGVPAFITIQNVDVEFIPAATNGGKVNFKASMVPKEPLYVVTSGASDVSQLTFIKEVQTPKNTMLIYGSLQATRTVDRWEFSDLEIGENAQIGKPRSDFPPEAIIAGSPEAEKATAEARKQNEEEAQRRKEQAARDEAEHQAQLKKQAEQNRIAEENRKREKEAAKQALLDATAPGAGYIGIMESDGRTQRVRLVFTEQKDFMIRAEVSNPDISAEHRTFSGQLKFETTKDSAPISLSGEIGMDRASSHLYTKHADHIVMNLKPIDDGMEGEAHQPVFGFRCKLRLQKENTAAAAR